MEQESSGSAPGAKQGTDATVGERRELWWTEASIWTDRMVSALGNGVKGGKWFSLIDKVIRPTTLDVAWHRVARNKGASGVDGQSVERFGYQAERYLSELHTELKMETYRPSPIKRVEIPKPDGRARPLGIPTVKDRIVQTALKMVIEPIPRVRLRRPEDKLRGPIPRRQLRLPAGTGLQEPAPAKAGDALREVDRLLKEGNTFVVDADLKSYPRVKPEGMLRHHPARPSDGAGRGIGERRPCAVVDRELPAPGYHDLSLIHI